MSALSQRHGNELSIIERVQPFIHTHTHSKCPARIIFFLSHSHFICMHAHTHTHTPPHTHTQASTFSSNLLTHIVFFFHPSLLSSACQYHHPPRLSLWVW